VTIWKPILMTSPDRQRIRQILMPLGRSWAPEEEQSQTLLELFQVISPTRIADGGTTPRAELAICGELCAYTAPLIARDLIDRAPVRGRLVLDLGEVTFCDTAGTRLLASIRRKMERWRTVVELDPVSRPVSHLLALSGEARLFSYRPSDGPEPAEGRAQPVERTERFQITNREGGQVIDLTVDGELSPDHLDDIERRLLRLISVRQPSRLNLKLRSTDAVAWASDLTRAHEALASVGGVLLVTTDDAADGSDP